MKKLVSLISALAICLSLCVPAFAAGVEKNINGDASVFGYTFVERDLMDGRYEIDSYYNGEHQKTYTIKKGSTDIYVEIVGSSKEAGARTNNVYVIHGFENQSEPLISPQAERWGSLGYINYKNSAILGDIRAYLMSYGTSVHARRVVEAPAETPVDDLVAIISGFILDAGLQKSLKALGYSVESVAGQLLTSVISSLGITVIKGAIKSALTTTVETVETTWDFKATSNESGASTVYLRDQGKTILFMYDDNEWDQMEKDFTIANWKNSSFARLVWAEMYPSFVYPGVKSYTSN